MAWTAAPTSSIGIPSEMSFSAQKLLALPPIETRQQLSRRDTVLYALGLGAEDLEFVFEEHLKALPTMAVVMASPGFIWRDPELGVDWKRLLHGEQQLELFAPLPTEGMLRGETTFEAVYDKGAEKGALVYTARRIFDESGTHLATDTRSIFLRGNGGCGGTPGLAPKPHDLPEGHEPDAVVDLPTAPNQALIYRLSGDYNPLHIDPDVARTAGFEQPILHGLCTYGVVGRALLSAVAGNEPTRLKKMNVRFSAPVFPGETIRTEIWHETDSSFAFRARVLERDLVVVNNGYVELVNPQEREN
jgi:acyl dehydratase